MSAPDHETVELSTRFMASPFGEALALALKRRGLALEYMCDLRDRVAHRLIAEYGAMYVAAESVRVPPRCIFLGEDEVQKFQAETETSAELIGEAKIELQRAAMNALLDACAEAQTQGLEITPRGGAEAARRSYTDTVRLWASRFEPALEHWVAQGQIDMDEAARLRALMPTDQIAAVLKLEERGIFFSKYFSKSILYSVAAPGASQHLAMLAFDAAEFAEARVREILARHGWFQTVQSDLPHFTFLGVREKELPTLGLRRVEEHGQIFWIPNVA